MKIKWCPQDKIWMVGWDNVGGGFIVDETFTTFKEAWTYKKRKLRFQEERNK